MTNPTNYVLTGHARNRLQERCKEFDAIVKQISDSHLRIQAAYDYMSTATEEKSFLNNSRFVTMLGEKYGFDKAYTFFIRDNAVFVGVVHERGRFIVTVLNRADHNLPHIRHKVQKYRKAV